MNSLTSLTRYEQTDRGENSLTKLYSEDEEEERIGRVG